MGFEFNTLKTAIEVVSLGDSKKELRNLYTDGLDVVAEYDIFVSQHEEYSIKVRVDYNDFMKNPLKELNKAVDEKEEEISKAIHWVLELEKQDFLSEDEKEEQEQIEKIKENMSRVEKNKKEYEKDKTDIFQETIEELDLLDDIDEDYQEILRMFEKHKKINSSVSGEYLTEDYESSVSKTLAIAKIAYENELPILTDSFIKALFIASLDLNIKVGLVDKDTPIDDIVDDFKLEECVVDGVEIDLAKDLFTKKKVKVFGLYNQEG